jgi:hypothetical protein
MWLSYGDPNNVQLALSDLSIINTDTPFPPTVPAELAQQIRKKTPVDFTQWRYNKFPNNERYATISQNVGLSWVGNPSNTQVAVYGFPWLFLADTQTYQPCEVDIQKTSPSEVYGPGMHATRAKWSADGRYLAMLVEPEHFGGLLPFSSIAVLDVTTGSWYEPDLKFSKVQDMAWLTDGRHLVAHGMATNDGLQRTVLIDALAAQYRILPFDRQGLMLQDFELAITPNGNNLLLMCGDILEKGVCLSTISLP